MMAVLLSHWTGLDRGIPLDLGLGYRANAYVRALPPHLLTLAYSNGLGIRQTLTPHYCFGFF